MSDERIKLVNENEGSSTYKPIYPTKSQEEIDYIDKIIEKLNSLIEEDVRNQREAGLNT